jgi:hypothetical protein
MRMDYENFQYLHVSVFPNRGKPWLIIKQGTLYLIILCLLEMQRQILFSKTPFDFEKPIKHIQRHFMGTQKSFMCELGLSSVI